ncbi:uncharacterized protein [Asterias amurensis]|uniref:uncharacterized protein n=1 Tax=Asterias amurensis TaxID=7602 RepID=UPI003AB6A20B
MDRGCWLIHLLLMCSLDTTPIAVNAQSVTFLGPSRNDPVIEGNLVELECIASRLMAGYIVEWTRFGSVDCQEQLLARNGMGVDPRYTLVVRLSSARTQIETLIFNATREDTAVFGCQVRDSSNLTVVVEAETVTLTVLYFPSAMYPICTPNGPFTVQEGTTVNMSCTAEIGNPPVQMQFITNSTSHASTCNIDSKEQMRSLQLSVTAGHDGGSYQCKISPGSLVTTPFTGMNRSCTIGPITVGQMIIQHPLSSVESIVAYETSLKPIIDQSNFNMSYCQPCQTIPSKSNESNVVGTPWLVASLTSLILFIISLIINIFLLIKHQHLKITKEKETNVAKADLYMELQPTEDKNKVYMEPTTATNTQHTYYQPGKVETDDSPEYDYARPEGSTNTDYEAVSKPPRSTGRTYQNINS